MPSCESGRAWRAVGLNLLGLDRWQTEEFLASRGAIRPYDLADLEVDRATLVALR